MPNDTQIAIRLPQELVARLDAAARKLEKKTPGVHFGRAAVVRMILTGGLAELEGKLKGGTRT